MKSEFNKWIREKYCKDCNLWYLNACGKCNNIKEKKMIWIACLEWILENSSCEDACDFKENIKNELDLLSKNESN